MSSSLSPSSDRSFRTSASTQTEPGQIIIFGRPLAPAPGQEQQQQPLPSEALAWVQDQAKWLGKELDKAFGGSFYADHHEDRLGQGLPLQAGSSRTAYRPFASAQRASTSVVDAGSALRTSNTTAAPTTPVAATTTALTSRVVAASSPSLQLGQPESNQVCSPAKAPRSLSRSAAVVPSAPSSARASSLAGNVGSSIGKGKKRSRSRRSTSTDGSYTPPPTRSPYRQSDVLVPSTSQANRITRSSARRGSLELASPRSASAASIPLEPRPRRNGAPPRQYEEASDEEMSDGEIDELQSDASYDASVAKAAGSALVASRSEAPSSQSRLAQRSDRISSSDNSSSSSSRGTSVSPSAQTSGSKTRKGIKPSSSRRAPVASSPSRSAHVQEPKRSTPSGTHASTPAKRATKKAKQNVSSKQHGF